MPLSWSETVEYTYTVAAGGFGVQDCRKAGHQSCCSAKGKFNIVIHWLEGMRSEVSRGVYASDSHVRWCLI